MNRLKYLQFLAFILSLIIARSGAAQSVDAMIQALADADPAVRAQAEVTLRATSENGSVRPALIQATRNGDPAVSSAAARVLLSLPWYQATDPQEVQTFLRAYGTVTESRSTLVYQLARLPNGVGWPALLRLVVEDPSEEICWSIANHFHTRVNSRTGILSRVVRDGESPVSAEIADLVREKLNPSGDRPAAMVIAARAWESKDLVKSLDFYRRAVEAEVKNPTQDSGELEEVFGILVAGEIRSAHYDEAARLLRIQCTRIAMSQNAVDPDPIFALFVLHSRYGPLQGFEQDLQRYSDYTGSPEVLYALSRIHSRSGRWMEAMALRDAAQSASLDAEGHLLVAMWLSQLSWNDLSRREATAALGNDDPEMVQIRAVAQERLSQLAAEEEDDVGALEHLKQVVALSRGTTTPAGMALLASYRARIALARNDVAAVKTALDEVMDLRIYNSSIVLKIYPLLKSAGRIADAQRLFDGAFQQEEKNLTQSGRDDAEDFNNLAWLCVRCDQRLTQAADYAKRALAIDPDNAAYMDTLADVEFRLGNVQEAIDLEMRALKFRPEDEFMHKQLARFRAGVKY